MLDCRPQSAVIRQESGRSLPASQLFEVASTKSLIRYHIAMATASRRFTLRGLGEKDEWVNVPEQRTLEDLCELVDGQKRLKCGSGAIVLLKDVWELAQEWLKEGTVLDIGAEDEKDVEQRGTELSLRCHLTVGAAREYSCDLLQFRPSERPKTCGTLRARNFFRLRTLHFRRAAA